MISGKVALGGLSLEFGNAQKRFDELAARGSWPSLIYPPDMPAVMDQLNCLFCYCPLYSGECPGEPEIRIIKGNEVKDCTDCSFPHQPENYDDMIRCLVERIS